MGRIDAPSRPRSSVRSLLAPGRPHAVRTSVVPWIVLATALVGGLVAAGLAYHRFAHAGRILPGVSIASVDVGGLSPHAALERLADAGLDPHADLVLTAGPDRWQQRASEAGVILDVRATVVDAYAIGRTGRLPGQLWNRLSARASGRTVPPVISVDAAALREAVGRIADDFDRPAQNATVVIEGAAVRAVPAVTGRFVDLASSVGRVTAAAARAAWPLPAVELEHGTIAPEIADASVAADEAAALLAAPVTVRNGADAWALEPSVLAAMLTVTNSSGTVALGLDDGRFAEWLAPVTETISATARLPRFHWDETTADLVLVAPGEPGRHVEVEATRDRVLAVAGGAPRTVIVAVTEIPPAVADNARGRDLGIRALIVEQTSRYVGSPPERIHNIGLAAAPFDGVLVPPDAVVSFNEGVGDISAETGYQETKIIMDGATRDGVGGGVCQVSTTLFRAAFYAGMPIVERYAHGYRVPYYEQGGVPPGLDATVFSPAVDLKFRNDSGAWVLIESESDARKATVTFRFYGTPVARGVTLEGPTIGRQVPPPAPRIEVDPSLAPGETKVLEYARSGASVSVTRVITQTGAETREVFYSGYRPTGLLTAVSPLDAAAAQPAPTPDQAQAGAPPSGATPGVP